MIDLLQAGQDALYAALKPIENDPSMPAGLGVFQHVPQSREPPFIVIGQMVSESDDEHGDQFEKITAEIHSVYRGKARAPLLAMMHAVRSALDGQAISASVGQFEEPRWLNAAAGEAIADGVTYVGLSTFEFYAEP